MLSSYCYSLTLPSPLLSRKFLTHFASPVEEPSFSLVQMVELPILREFMTLALAHKDHVLLLERFTFHDMSKV